MKRFFTFLSNGVAKVAVLALLAIFCAWQSNAQITVTATAGTLGPTLYPSLGGALGAFQAINAGTHQGAITITVNSSYAETATAVLNANAAPAAYTSVLIKPAPATNPVITGNIANNAVIFLFGATNVTIDGSNTVGGTTRNLSINNPQGTGVVIRLGNNPTTGASNNTIKNCRLYQTAPATGGAIIYSGSGTSATMFPVAAAGVPNSNNTIENDSFYNSQTGILAWGPATFDDNWNIRNNVLSSLGFTGMQINNASNSTINGNDINNISINGGTQVSGILLSWACNNVTIRENKIVAISNTFPVAAPNPQAAGIFVSCNTTGTIVNIYNNFIANVRGQGNASVLTNGHGILHNFAGTLNIYHNTIKLTTDQAVAGTPSAICFGPNITLPPAATSSSVDLRNNIIVNSQTLGTRYGIYCGVANTLFSNIDYNDYFATSGNLGFIGGIARVNLTQIIAGFGSNANSVAIDPVFISPVDLHLQTNTINFPLSAGTPLAAVPTDIDGVNRSVAAPTIGAHELINKITFPALGATCRDDTSMLHNVQIESPTAGGIVTSGALAPRIYYRKGAGPWVSAAGIFVSGPLPSDTRWKFVIDYTTVGGVTFGDVISYFVVAQTTTGTVFSSPVAGMTAVDVNTITTPPTTPLTYNVNAVALIGFVTSNQMCFSPTVPVNVPYSYASVSGGPLQYTLVWTSGTPPPAGVPVFTPLPASPLNVNVPAATAPFPPGYGGNVTIRNATTGCQRVYPITLSVNPLPATITGPDTTCVGSSVVFTSTTTGGTWTSLAPGIATAGLTTGVISGVTGGNATIIYTLPTSCTTFKSIDIIAPPGPITGVATLCPLLTTTLSNATVGGGWSSGNPSIATVDPVTGVVTGVSPGNALIGYGIPGCSPVFRVVTVNPVPDTITGTLYACEGLTTTLSTTSTGGTWISGAPSMAVIGSLTGIVTGISTGLVPITYKFLSTGCIRTNTVNILATPGPIMGGNVICQGLSVSLTNALPGGTWSSSMPGIISVGSSSGIATGIASIGTARITYTLPTGCRKDTIMHVNAPPTTISGAATVCEESTITLTNGTPGGTWTSGSVTTAVVNSITGVVTGINAGVVNISYSTLACNPAVFSVTVLPTPKPITGGITICNGASTTTVIDTTLGGVWTMTGIGSSISGTSTGPGVASAVVTGLMVGGTYAVTYTTPNGCRRIAPIIVDTLPAPINGVDSVCPGRTVTLSTASTGGVWSSANSSIASVIAASGDVTGVMNGSTTITYAALSSCYRTKPFRVTNPIPLSVTLTRNPAGDPVCSGVPVTFTAHPVNGGVAPMYEWQLFGVSQDTTYVDSSYTYVPTHGDVIRVFLFNSLEVCAAPFPAYVDMPINVYPNIMPSITISTPMQNPAGGAYPYPYRTASFYGQPFTFNSLITSGGPGVTYQWYVDGDPVPGATNNTFVRDVYDDDQVWCKVIGNPDCPTGTTSTSGSIMIYADYLSASNVDGASIRFSLFPNPNDGNFRLTGKLAASSTDEVKYEVVNVLGQVVARGETKAENGNVDTKVDLGKNTAAGTYMLRVVSSEGEKVFHFVVNE